MKKIIVNILGCLIFLISAFAFAFPSLHKDWEKIRYIFKRNGHQENQINLLFIQQARKVSMIKKNNHCYELTLNQINPKVLYFSNEPKKVSGYLPASEFVMMLRNNEKHYSIIPNVALVGYISGKKGPQEINKVVTIANPRFKNNIISYKACLLEKGKIKDNLKVANATLFFDHIHPWPP